MTKPRFEELDWQDSALGEISLRRRVEPTLGIDVYEVKLGEEFLMSSLFTVAEIELARLGLAQASAVSPNGGIDVLVGGLGLGYTAATALEDDRVRSVTVVEAIRPVIDWHERQLLPDTVELTVDPRTRLHEGDFFAIIGGDTGFPADLPETYDAILLDIDHTPRHVLNPSHAPFYTSSGLAALRRYLRPSGVFALWSDDPPDDEFMDTLASEFSSTSAHIVDFPNPLTGGESSNTVYVARS
ncbi:MAG: spermidine synthase [Actinobacteria bacterium]|nr:spermidine synthase [Actinomycetota bacterium]